MLGASLSMLLVGGGGVELLSMVLLDCVICFIVRRVDFVSFLYPMLCPASDTSSCPTPSHANLHNAHATLTCAHDVAACSAKSVAILTALFLLFDFSQHSAMTASLSTASSKVTMHLSRICRRYHQSHHKSLKPYIESRRYFLGLNGINACSPSKRTGDGVDYIPPLDLLSVLDAAKSSKEIMQSSRRKNGNNDPNEIPYYAVGEEDASHSTSKKADLLSEEIAYIKTRLNRKNLAKSHKSQLTSELKKRQNALDQITGVEWNELESVQSAEDERVKSMASEHSDKINNLSREISHLKKCLLRKSLPKDHASTLKHEMRMKQNKIDMLSGKNSDDVTSTKIKSLSDEVSHLKSLLRNNKSLSQKRLCNLEHEILMKENKIDVLSGKKTRNTHDDVVSIKIRGLSDEISHLRNLLRNKSLSYERAARLKREITKKQSKIVRLWNGDVSEKERVVRIADGQSIQDEIRHTKSFVLPRPKASSKGVIIPHFDTDTIQTQANGTVLARSGTTSILSTVILVPPETTSNNANHKQTFEQTILDSIKRQSAANGSLFLPLQVEYRERWHASGKIPTHNQRRRDNSGPLSDREVLASRAIDRTLRPWLMKGLGDSTSDKEWSGLLPENIVVNCQVQSYDTRSSILDQQRTHSDPTALAINSAIAAIYQSSYSDSATKLHAPLDAAACIKLAMRKDGSVIYDPTLDEAEECAFELLYAGTRDRVLMFEFSAKRQGDGNGNNIDPGIAEDVVADALRLAKQAILPIIQHQEDLHAKYSDDRAAMGQDETRISDEELAQMLGIESRPRSDNDGISLAKHSTINSQDADELLNDACEFVWSRLEHAASKSFGYDGQSSGDISTSLAYIYDSNLPSKKLR